MKQPVLKQHYVVRKVVNTVKVPLTTVSQNVRPLVNNHAGLQGFGLGGAGLGGFGLGAGYGLRGSGPGGGYGAGVAYGGYGLA